MKSHMCIVQKIQVRRTPQGVRGLKCCGRSSLRRCNDMSHPARGAWIEIGDFAGLAYCNDASHPARGAWIEICWPKMKFPAAASHPARGAWIEIGIRYSPATPSAPSHPARGAWIEILFTCIL